jgi:poly(3-hydroxybutyrate) depolymerase
MNLNKSLMDQKMKYVVTAFLVILFASNYRSTYGQEPKIIDKHHYSEVLGEIRNYRVFLPPSYEVKPEKRYPVIYYYHGWSQRYFGSVSGFQADQGNSNDGDNIANFVARNEVIVVKADGYNRRPNDEYYLRPHNIGPVETYRQFPLYFPEFVEHIDANFRTIPEREQRAISGLSMGGFMTFWIGGKYPHLVSAAGNFCGSTEFFVGPIDFPVEYRHQEMYKNYEGMDVRLHYGDKDFIRAYHKDMNKIWTQVMNNYEYKIYDAGHSTAGLGEMFSSFMKGFENPPPKPSKWHHSDVYPSFEVWGYKVNSDRNLPGFTILENVNEHGFRSSSRTFLPNGEVMPFVEVDIITPPVYEKNQLYNIIDVTPLNGKYSTRNIKSDEKGRLHIKLNGDLHEIGINKQENTPNLAIASYEISNLNWATYNKEIALNIKLLNKGGKSSGKIIAKLEPFRKSAVVIKNESILNNIDLGEVKSMPNPFIFMIKDEVEMERFRLIMTDEKGNTWEDMIDIPVMIDGPEIKDFVIADGKEFVVATAGDKTASVMLGKGNGDGIANPGETIVILIKDGERYHRALLYTNDKFINPSGINIRESDYWGRYDNVGASAKYSVPVISSNAPSGHKLKFFTEHWLPDYPDHIIKRGVVEIKVEGTDQTPPELKWVKMFGDNSIHANLYDGGEIKTVRAKFTLTKTPDMAKDPVKYFEVELYDNGKEGDRTNSDRVFGRKINEKGFGLYKVQIEAEDVYGNKMVKDWDEVLVVH